MNKAMLIVLSLQKTDSHFYTIIQHQRPPQPVAFHSGTLEQKLGEYSAPKISTPMK